MRYVSGTDERGNAIDVRDPLVEKIQSIVASSNENDRVTALLTLSEIFGTDLPQNAAFVSQIQHAWHRLTTEGARQAIISTVNL